VTTSRGQLRNIFLHFLNRESLLIYGAERNLSHHLLLESLTEYLTVAALLTDEYCLVPPGWVDEYKTTRLALQRRIELLQAGIVRLPMRETTLEEFHRKRLIQYGPFRNDYPDLFQERNIQFLQDNGGALLGRQSSVGSRIRSQWAEQSVSASDVGDFPTLLSTRKRTAATRVADHLAEEGAAIAWPGVQRQLLRAVGSAPQQYRHLLQRLNFEVYLNEYELRVLSGIPLARYDFRLTSEDLRYDYRAFRAALEAAQVWNIVRSLDALSVVQLRNTRGFLDFRIAFDLAAGTSNSVTEIRRRFALSSRMARMVIRETGELEIFSSARAHPSHGYHLSSSQIHALAARLERSSTASGQFLEASGARIERVGMLERIAAIVHEDSVTIGDEKRPGARLAIFVALDIELRILARRWNLQNSYGDRLWTGFLGENSVSIYSPKAMGRVQAALETLEVLSDVHETFDMLIVAGLAGGFEQKAVQKGSLIIADSVVDLAARKIAEEARGTRPVFRPKEFSVDHRLREFLQSGSFDRAGWLGSVVEQEEWPEGLRPVLHYGPICSGDEVVSSGDWVRRLLDAWPMLLGVEMEAGGVCAAAERLSRKVAVVRVVSDFADPAKADDEWRVRGMKTIANLFEHLDFSSVCRRSPTRGAGDSR
jgi:nucleoside phosphorylase